MCAKTSGSAADNKVQNPAQVNDVQTFDVDSNAMDTDFCLFDLNRNCSLNNYGESLQAPILV